MNLPRIRPTALVLMTALLLAACGSSDEDPPADDTATAEDVDAAVSEADELSITDVRSRMSPRRAGVAAVYLTIENPTEQDDALIGAAVSPDIAGIVEVHETFEIDEGHDNGAMEHGDDGMSGDEGMSGDDAPMMGMREIDAIELPAGATVELVPGGLHIMLIDLVDDLEVGDRFEITLTFEQAGEQTVTAEVREQA